MSQKEYRSQSWYRWLTTLFTEQAVTYRRLIREINHINGVCLTFTVRGDGDRGKRTFVTFNPVVTVHLIPAENRKSEWNQCAINRAHFQRRIQFFEELFTAL